MSRINRRAAFLLSALGVACGQGSEGRADATGDRVVQDSSGIRIVENEQPPTGGWRVDPSPVFTLGWASGDPTFTWIQSGQILRGGGAIVGDFGAKAIYGIGPGGSLMTTWGREGEGPGEYRGLDAMLLRGDSILISDGRLRRVTLLAFDGKVLATWPLPGAFLHQVSSFLADGRLLLVPGSGYNAVSEIRPEWVFETQPILAADLEHGKVDTIASLPHLRRWYGTRGASPGPVSVTGRAGGVADGFAWSRSDRPEVRWYDQTGRLLQIARWNEQPAPVTAELRRQMASNLENSLRARGADATLVAAQLAELEKGFDRHDGPLPYWDAMHVDRQGNVWLRQYSLPGHPSANWRVITREGGFLGWIEVPNIVSILDITDDRILAVRLNDVDVPAVVMFELSKT